MIIDSSKNPFYARLLNRLENLDCYFLHVVRDPRGVAYSRHRAKWDPASRRYIPGKKLSYSAATWLMWNLFIEAMFRGRNDTRYRRVRYEDFANNPEPVLDDIVQWVSDTDQQENGRSRNENGGLIHQVAGNPMRLDRNKIIRIDEDWRTELDWKKRMGVNALTWPLLLKYGYRFSSL